MDKDTEDLMLKMLISLKAKLGILLVTHRISLIKKICDRIYILEDRTIKESGTHYELISSENIYKRYWEELNWKFYEYCIFWLIFTHMLHFQNWFPGSRTLFWVQRYFEWLFFFLPGKAEIQVNDICHTN